MGKRRITIYDLAKELGISASYISRALNDHPSINLKVRAHVKQKAQELNYKHNSQAANLRRGTSKTIGVIVPHINQNFFSEAIAGIEEVCFEHNYSLIICQSHESFVKECKAIDTLIRQNVDCLIISVSAETQSAEHLQTVKNSQIDLIQFDRCMDQMTGFKVLNDNRDTAFKVTQLMIEQGYQKIAFLGGPSHLNTFKRRKEGFLTAIEESTLSIPPHFIIDDILAPAKAMEVARQLLLSSEVPDAFLTVSDHQSLGVLQTAESLGLKVPDQLGIFGFANETFASMIRPPLSSVEQRSKEIGRRAAQIYFEHLLHRDEEDLTDKEEIIKSEILIRGSALRRPLSA